MLDPRYNPPYRLPKNPRDWIDPRRIEMQLNHQRLLEQTKNTINDPRSWGDPRLKEMRLNHQRTLKQARNNQNDPMNWRNPQIDEMELDHQSNDEHCTYCSKNTDTNLLQKNNLKYLNILPVPRNLNLLRVPRRNKRKDCKEKKDRIFVGFIQDFFVTPLDFPYQDFGIVGCNIVDESVEDSEGNHDLFTNGDRVGMMTPYYTVMLGDGGKNIESPLPPIEGYKNDFKSNIDSGDVYDMMDAFNWNDFFQLKNREELRYFIIVRITYDSKCNTRLLRVTKIEYILIPKEIVSENPNPPKTNNEYISGYIPTSIKNLVAFANFDPDSLENKEYKILTSFEEVRKIAAPSAPIPK